MEISSRDIARAAVRIALSASREEEKEIQQELNKEGIKSTAVDYGGEFISSVMKMVERTVVAAKREGIIDATHHEEGAMAGATREAVSQLSGKAIGLNVGGKIGIARAGDHLSVCAFFGIGLLHLNEVAIGLGHRTI